MTRVLAAAGALLAALVAAGPAAAQTPAADPAAVAAQAPPAPPAPPAATPAPALLRTTFAGTRRVGGRPYLVEGSRLHIRGVLRPYVPGQQVTVRVYRRSRKLVARKLAVTPIAGTADGAFALKLRAPRGRLVVKATHYATAELGRAQAPVRRITVLRAGAGPGSAGPLVHMLQRGLDDLGYAVPRNGSYDGGTARAVLAYRKVNGMARTMTASRAVVERVLARRGAFKPRNPGAGRHAEADLSRQVLALIDKGKVRSTYHISSGAPATPTIIGSFRVYRKQPGTNALGMVHSSYFRGGYAIHGYASVPTYPASHGCLRVPIPNARYIYDWLHMGDGVIVYP